MDIVCIFFIFSPPWRYLGMGLRLGLGFTGRCPVPYMVVPGWVFSVGWAFEGFQMGKRVPESSGEIFGRGCPLSFRATGEKGTRALVKRHDFECSKKPRGWNWPNFAEGLPKGGVYVWQTRDWGVGSPVWAT